MRTFVTLKIYKSILSNFILLYLLRRRRVQSKNNMGHLAVGNIIKNFFLNILAFFLYCVQFRAYLVTNFLVTVGY